MSYLVKNSKEITDNVLKAIQKMGMGNNSASFKMQELVYISTISLHARLGNLASKTSKKLSKAAENSNRSISEIQKSVTNTLEKLENNSKKLGYTIKSINSNSLENVVEFSNNSGSGAQNNVSYNFTKTTESSNKSGIEIQNSVIGNLFKATEYFKNFGPGIHKIFADNFIKAADSFKKIAPVIQKTFVKTADIFKKLGPIILKTIYNKIANSSGLTKKIAPFILKTILKTADGFKKLGSIIYKSVSNIIGKTIGFSKRFGSALQKTVSNSRLGKTIGFSKKLASVVQKTVTKAASKVKNFGKKGISKKGSNNQKSGKNNTSSTSDSETNGSENELNFKFPQEAFVDFLNMGIQKELSKKKFEVLLSSKSSAKKMMDDITNLSKKVKIFDQSTLEGNAQTLLKSGMNADQVVPNLDAISNISMGDTHAMDSLTSSLAQVINMGTLTEDSLLAMVEAGFNPLNEICRTTGLSMDKVNEEMMNGTITAQMVTNAFQSAASEGGQFFGVANQLSNTLGGHLQSTTNNLNNVLFRLYEIIAPMVHMFLDLIDAALFLADTFFDVTDFFSEVLNKFSIGKGAIITLRAIIVSLASAFMTYKLVMGLAAVAQAILNGVMIANPIGLIIAGVVGLITFIYLLINSVEGWGDAFNHLYDTIVSVGKGVWSYLKWLGAEISTGFMNGLNQLEIGIRKITKLWNGKSSDEIINKLEEKIKARTLELNEARKLLKEEGSNYFSEAWNSANKIGGSLSFKTSSDKESPIILDNTTDVSSNNAGAESLTAINKNFSLLTDSYNKTTTDNSLFNDKGGLSFISDTLEKYNPKNKIAPPKKLTDETSANSLKTVNPSIKSTGASTNSSIVTGGEKSSTINISIKDLIGVLNIQGKDFNETTDKMVDQTADALLRLLAMANYSVG